MGCVNSGHYTQDHETSDPNKYFVDCVDYDETVQHAGYLVIGENSLKFFIDKPLEKEIEWPYKMVKRFGYQQNLFSFQGGRRSPTETSILLFRCRRAEQLFLAVKERISHLETHQQMDGNESRRADRLVDSLNWQANLFTDLPLSVNNSEGAYVVPDPVITDGQPVVPSVEPSYENQPPPSSLTFHQPDVFQFTSHYFNELYNGRLADGTDEQYLSPGLPRISHDYFNDTAVCGNATPRCGEESAQPANAVGRTGSVTYFNFCDGPHLHTQPVNASVKPPNGRQSDKVQDDAEYTDMDQEYTKAVQQAAEQSRSSRHQPAN